MVRCQRCGEQRHTRDLDELVVPTTIRLHALVVAEIPAPGERAPELSEALTTAISAFRDEASEPLCRALLAAVASGADAADAGFIESVGRALYLSGDQIAVVVAALD